VSRSGSLRTLSLEIEPAPNVGDAGELAARVSQRILEGLGLTVPVQVVQPEGLPRFEMKSRRFVVEA
jgi:phenylacetate-coenzyme A ligase PaaK-like adenylate-forming protein